MNDALGGVRGTFLMLGNIGSRVFKDQISSGLNNTIASL